MDIVTEKQEGTYWSRFHVEIILHQGVHNDGTREKAALCQKCAIDLLTDALKRVKNGERATAGTESSKQRGWSNDI